MLSCDVSDLCEEYWIDVIKMNLANNEWAF